ncbi:ChrB protein [Alicyclobacillus tolerans]|uniref:Chromate resistance protein ChrB n=1 Tax=Alicyclobacillus tolerans TaxID=90970 RepID=UPI001F27FFB7|nr:Chromate resistance protein ChrB [Alicyclobacillus tolerans]MCF8567421.1 ChrB protein [Alicyclobacillus tolerans]
MRSWVILHYKIPNKPSAGRVYVWRKMKSLGAILLHDAVWVLPYTPRNHEKFQWLSSEILELGGQCMLWRGELPLPEQEEELARQFTQMVDTDYADMLDALAEKNADLRALSLRYQQVRAKDYFQSELGQRVHSTLLSYRERDSE